MKKKVLLSSVLTIALCLCLIAGSTFALFTSQSNFNISVTAGNVKVEAGLTEPVLKSAKPVVVDANTDTSKLVQDENGKYYELAVQQNGKFANEGTAQIVDGMLVLNKITPGDRVEFEVTVANTSDVAILKRLVVECVSGFALMNGLEITVGEGTNPMVALDTYTSAWAKVDANATIDNIKVAVELPVDAGNEYQGLTSVINFKVEAVQGNANVDGDVETITYLETVTDEATLATALADGGNVVIAEDTAITNTIEITKDATISILADVDASANTSRPFWVKGANLTIEAAKNANINVGAYGLVDIREGDSNVTITNGNYFGNTDNGAFVKFRGAGAIEAVLNNVNYTDASVNGGRIADANTDYTGAGIDLAINGGEYNACIGVTGYYIDLVINEATLNVTNFAVEMGKNSTAIIENSTIVVNANGINAAAPQACVAASNAKRDGSNGGNITVNNCTLKSNAYVFAIYSGDNSAIVANGCTIEQTGNLPVANVWEGNGTITVDGVVTTLNP